MNLTHDRFVRGIVIRHSRWTVLLDRLGCWLVVSGRVTVGWRWWK